MVRSQTWWWLLGGVGGILGTVWLGSVLLNRDPPVTPIVQVPPRSDRLPVSPSDENNFVGSAVCATCHSDLSEAFHHHPMGRSLANAHEAPEIENFNVTEFSPPGSRRYRIERTADAVRHHEVLLDEDGSEIYDQATDVRYALGSGKRGRAYLIEHDGMLFKSSLAWFSPHQEWGLSPGYPPDQHKRFERRITEGCINCHVGRMSAKPSAPDIFLPPVVIEAAISCERCHGPGREHAAAHEAGTVTDKQHIIHPARLDHAQRDAICAQCHLHGKATVLRTGQRVFDFRPGQRIEDNRIVFVAPPSTAKGSAANALSQVELMATSVCFQKSNGRMGCTSCHDPHSMPTAETRVDYYRAKCLACHDNDNRNCRVPVAERQQQEPTDSCIACHMPPALHVGNILHVSFSDHRILRRPLNDSQDNAASSTNSADLVLFDHAKQRLPKLEVDRAIAFMLAGGIDGKSPTPAEAQRAERLLLPVYQAQPTDIDALEVLGAVCQMQGRPRDAEKWWLEALKIDPRRETVLQNLALMYFDNKRFKPAREFLERFLEVNPWHGHMHGRLAGVLGSLGDWHKSASVAEHALELNPTLTPLHNWLAHAYQQLDRPADSERHKQLFKQLEKQLPSTLQTSPTDNSR